MGVLQHPFVSAIIDGIDPTQVQPSNWNAAHLFAGGLLGQILVRDTTDATNGAKWTSSPLVASLLFGTMVAPASPSDGELWVEAAGASPARVIAIKVRDAGVIHTLASVTF